MENIQEDMELDSVSPIKTEQFKSVPSDDKLIDVPQVDNLKPHTPKAKKRKKPKDVTAPRQPLTGYIRFSNDRREAVRTANPALSLAEITKLLAGEWSNLPVDKKQQYLDAAEQDRERYSKEFEAYKKTDAYKQFTQQHSDKKIKETNEKPGSQIINSQTPSLSKESHEMDFGNFDIPIFTEEFLDHNKTRDAELRQLRKINTDYEQQNAILSKHIDNMRSAISKLETEITQQERTNASLEQHLNHLRTSLSSSFAGLKLTDMKDVMPTLENIDNYMTSLHSLLLEDNHQDTKLLQTVRDVVAKLEFSG